MFLDNCGRLPSGAYICWKHCEQRQIETLSEKMNKMSFIPPPFSSLPPHSEESKSYLHKNPFVYFCEYRVFVEEDEFWAWARSINICTSNQPCEEYEPDKKLKCLGRKEALKNPEGYVLLLSFDVFGKNFKGEKHSAIAIKNLR
ncbi:hypothetical protein AVEN_4530-1 [Araneus ventricosus]|uniref:Uncharacterized protein n=1 Tax=Araneus ventricosus TaxID=182803 RepID=A0A4Y2BKN7_ARAVE|nr:hypothetical protein AVEN_4530-1 [Araneus ventricosus]